MEHVGYVHFGLQLKRVIGSPCGNRSLFFQLALRHRRQGLSNNIRHNTRPFLFRQLSETTRAPRALDLPAQVSCTQLYGTGARRTWADATSASICCIFASASCALLFISLIVCSGQTLVSLQVLQVASRRKPHENSCHHRDRTPQRNRCLA